MHYLSIIHPILYESFSLPFLKKEEKKNFLGKKFDKNLYR